ncbi:hypothetical protein [Amycolatopsis sp. FDAARGOS 1241]|uniref:hypothetical protein n=1 Tax=Amycolatopsis sp. FDAARGOS 1241 TaxID=2778070 RepID=UPI001EF31595|nr:hypothetical protein [Amycolatopsis sp. FDAARGOS 1241]
MIVSAYVTAYVTAGIVALGIIYVGLSYLLAPEKSAAGFGLATIPPARRRSSTSRARATSGPGWWRARRCWQVARRSSAESCSRRPSSRSSTC